MTAEQSIEKAIENTIKRNFYVDDMLKSVATIDEGRRLAGNLIQTCKTGGFKLTKWASSHRSTLEAIPEEDRTQAFKNLNFNPDDLQTEHALGMQWDIESDELGFRTRIKLKSATKRGMLSTISTIYDPLGLAAPAILPMRRTFQELCKAKIGWDDDIPPKQHKQWKKWLESLPQLESEFRINRCMKPLDFGRAQHAELHHFSDASESGYGAVSYIRIINHSNEVNCALLMSKARVAPLKQITIPRMELTAATVAIRLDKMLRRELDVVVDNSYFWTDSKTVLRYIMNKATRFHTFVANRLAVIHGGSTEDRWRYVNTAENPADECSRGHKRLQRAH
ncbi:uncharacterized protein LOC144353154 [Saccoglossus kowalevskii]